MFHVNPEALRAAARSYAATAEHLRIASAYHRAPSSLDIYEKGLILALKNTHEMLAERLQDRLDAAAKYLSLSAFELERAAAAYSTTDLAAASRLDSALALTPTGGGER